MILGLHEVEPWLHSWYRDGIETLGAKYNLVALLYCGHMKWSHGCILGIETG